ncbi:flagellar motor switch protein FliG, partial [Thioclava sp. BHET1]
MNELARFGAPPPADPVAGNAPPRGLTPRQKAAVIVRLLLSAGARMPLSALPEDLQAALTEQIGQMRAIDRGTLDAVIAEFQAAIDDLGLSFPDGIDGALSILDGHISSSTASRLRRM